MFFKIILSILIIIVSGFIPIIVASLREEITYNNNNVIASQEGIFSITNNENNKFY